MNYFKAFCLAVLTPLFLGMVPPPIEAAGTNGATPIENPLEACSEAGGFCDTWSSVAWCYTDGIWWNNACNAGSEACIR